MKTEYSPEQIKIIEAHAKSLRVLFNDAHILLIVSDTLQEELNSLKTHLAVEHGLDYHDPRFQRVVTKTSRSDISIDDALAAVADHQATDRLLVISAHTDQDQQAWARLLSARDTLFYDRSKLGSQTKATGGVASEFAEVDEAIGAADDNGVYRKSAEGYASDHPEAPDHARLTVNIPALAHALQHWDEEARRRRWKSDGRPDFGQDARYLMGILLSDECDQFYQPPEQFFREVELPKRAGGERVSALHGKLLDADGTVLHDYFKLFDGAKIEPMESGEPLQGATLRSVSMIGEFVEEAAMAARDTGSSITFTIYVSPKDAKPTEDPTAV